MTFSISGDPARSCSTGSPWTSCRRAASPLQIFVNLLLGQRLDADGSGKAQPFANRNVFGHSAAHRDAGDANLANELVDRSDAAGALLDANFVQTRPATGKAGSSPAKRGSGARA